MGKQKDIVKTRIKRKEKEDNLFSKKTSLIQNYKSVRNFTASLCRPLTTEDYVIQSMPDTSPAKWHLAHTTWFFETFILKGTAADYTGFHPVFGYLFNSYYVQAGERFPRPQRGLLSRPTVEEVFKYREYVDEKILELLETLPDEKLKDIESIIELGLNHEQQHQELILTDIKHMFSLNPLHPVYSNSEVQETRNVRNMEWIPFNEGLYTIGNTGKEFCYDNEMPQHKVYLNSFKLGSRLVTNGEYLDFINAGGYETPELWLSDGWYAAQQGNWNAPLYWEKIKSNWHTMTLSGFREINPAEPVCHVSYYEAEAYAHWAGARLPSEAEWESAASTVNVEGNFVENGIFHPVPPDELTSEPALEQMFGDVWEWTQSAYLPYPGFKPMNGALGEYNGKFMVNQQVLRGGSCATSLWHIRKTYRNFFPPSARWQFSGIRLARG
jgi:ergothioneine biosynthesis protein EgtB